MTRRRDNQRSLPGLLLIVCALVAQLLVPPGFMVAPPNGDRSAALMFCGSMPDHGELDPLLEAIGLPSSHEPANDQKRHEPTCVCAPALVLFKLPSCEDLALPQPAVIAVAAPPAPTHTRLAPGHAAILPPQTGPPIRL